MKTGAFYAAGTAIMLAVLVSCTYTPGEAAARFAPGQSVAMPLTGTRGLVLRHEGPARSAVLYADGIGALREITLDDDKLAPWTQE